MSMCPECKGAGDLITVVRQAPRATTVVDSFAALVEGSVKSRIKDLHAMCSYIGCTCQHKIPEDTNHGSSEARDQANGNDPGVRV